MTTQPNFKKKFPLGLVIGVVVAGYLGIELIKVVNTNFQLQRQTSALEQQIAQLQSQEAQLNYDIQYYQTDSFKEKEARAKLGLIDPGENVIVLPPSNQTSAASAAGAKAKPESNWKLWMDFLFGH